MWANLSMQRLATKEGQLSVPGGNRVWSDCVASHTYVFEKKKQQDEHSPVLLLFPFKVKNVLFKNSG